MGYAEQGIKPPKVERELDWLAPSLAVLSVARITMAAAGATFAADLVIISAGFDAHRVERVGEQGQCERPAEDGKQAASIHP